MMPCYAIRPGVRRSASTSTTTSESNSKSTTPSITPRPTHARSASTSTSTATRSVRKVSSRLSYGMGNERKEERSGVSEKDRTEKVSGRACTYDAYPCSSRMTHVLCTSSDRYLSHQLSHHVISYHIISFITCHHITMSCHVPYHVSCHAMSLKDSLAVIRASQLHD